MRDVETPASSKLKIWTLRVDHPGRAPQGVGQRKIARTDRYHLFAIFCPGFDYYSSGMALGCPQQVRAS